MFWVYTPSMSICAFFMLRKMFSGSPIPITFLFVPCVNPFPVMMAVLPLYSPTMPTCSGGMPLIHSVLCVMRDVCMF